MACRVRAIAAPAFCLLVFLALTPSVRTAAPPVATALDALAASVYPANRPGAAVIVVKDATLLLRKGYGLANLELQTPITPDMVFEVGSITKQFTAAGILMLAQKGKLSLSDDFRKYVTGFPMGDHEVSIESLLTHTSGIPNYTDMPKWQELSRSDLTVAQLVGVFSGEPLDFEPGTSWRYSNSGYVLLGDVIEQVSHQTYASFLDQRIFQPLHMTHSFYGSQRRVVAGRASGYEKLDDGQYANATFLSMTQPFAAGAIMSTVDDLATWNAALDGTSIVNAASKAKMWSSFKLADGRETGYGYGWQIGVNAGAPVQEHGGAINGFRSHVVRLPQDHVYVAVLSNDASASDAGRLAEELASMAAGRSLVDPAPVDIGVLNGDLVGVYEDAFKRAFTIAVADGKYALQRGATSVPLVPFGVDQFFIRGEFSRFVFERDSAGRPVRLRVQEFSHDVVAARTSKAVPKKLGSHLKSTGRIS